MWRSLITINRHAKEIEMPNNLIAPLHPGEVFFHEFPEALKPSQNKLAQDIGVPHAELMKLFTVREQ